MSVQASSPLTSVRFTSTKQATPVHDHCPLCIDSIVNPKHDDRPPAIVFLDMDGVMIGDRFSSPMKEKITLTAQEMFPQSDGFTDYHWTVAKGRHLHPQATKNLHGLIERIEASGQRALIVLSTAWRNDATLQQHKEEAFTPHSFCNYLCGKTAPERNEKSWNPECIQGFDFEQGAVENFGITLEKRADVIEYWLRDHGFDVAATNFVVVDDDSFAGLQRFGERFIRTQYLFLEKHLEQAAVALKVKATLSQHVQI